MNWWGRAMSAINAAMVGWNQYNMLPVELSGWDDYEARLARYYLSALYYNNDAYTTVNRTAEVLKSRRNLYKHIRSIYSPVARLVDLYVAKVYGGSLDMENATGGAIPIAGADDTFRKAVEKVWQWSNWGTQKTLYVRHGAMLGDVGIKIVDDRAKQKVRLEVLHPAKIKSVEKDEAGNVKRAVIEYECEETAEERIGLSSAYRPKSYTYREVITPDKFETFKDNEPFAYYTDAYGQAVTSWENEYGFVPLVLSQHRDMGLMWGANSFHTSMGKIDEINDAASLVNDQVRKTVNVLWWFAGVKKKEEVTASATDRDQIPALYGPAGSQPFAMVAPINVADAIANIDKMLSELERDMPELSLHRLRESGQASGVAAQVMYSDAIDRIEESRGNYDDALVRAQQMAVSIGAYNRYTDFSAYTLDSYKQGLLDHSIGNRPVIRDAISKAEKITALQQIEGTEELILKELDYDKEAIDKVLLRIDESARNAVSGLASSLFNPEETVDGTVTEQSPLETSAAVIPSPIGGGAIAA